MMKDKYLITYHNDNTGRAIWVSEKYCFETTDPEKYYVMRETNRLLTSCNNMDIADGIRLMLLHDGERHDKYS